MFLGLGMIALALLWARRVHRAADGRRASYRGPWLLGLAGACVFLLWLTLVSQRALPA